MRKNSQIKNLTIGAILGGMSVAGFMYMKNNPQIKKNIMGTLKDMERKKFEMLDKQV